MKAIRTHGARPDCTAWELCGIRVMASAVPRAYSGQWGRGLRHHWGPGAMHLVRDQAAKPPEAESNLILRLEFDYFTFWCFQIFRPLLLTCYITMPLMQKT